MLEGTIIIVITVVFGCVAIVAIVYGSRMAARVSRKGLELATSPRGERQPSRNKEQGVDQECDHQESLDRESVPTGCRCLVRDLEGSLTCRCVPTQRTSLSSVSSE